jgi:hypothetical protein
MGLWGRKSEETGENFLMGNFMIFIPTKYYCNKQMKEVEMSGACCMYGRKEKCIWGFDRDTWRSERERPSKDMGIDGKILKWIFKKKDVNSWTGYIWLRKGTSCMLLWALYCTSGFHKLQGVSGLAKELLASTKQVCLLEWVSEWVADWLAGWLELSS